MEEILEEKKNGNKVAEKPVVDDYTGKDIEILSELEGVRKRPGMYIGSTNLTGLHHLVWEILDNAVDEAVNGYGNKITVTLWKDGSVSVEDEGRGIPVDVLPQTGRPAVETIYTVLHSGGKFNSKAYATSGGLHGVGTTVTNALCEWCEVKINKGGFSYFVRFKDGGKIDQPCTQTGKTNKHGTTCRFKPDPKIFPNTKFSYDTIANRLEERSYLCTGIHFIIKDEATGNSNEYFCEHGLKEYVGAMNKNKTPLGDIIDINDDVNGIKVEIAMQWCLKVYQETILSYANEVRTSDGGTHEIGFKAALTKTLNDWATANGVAKSGQPIAGEDIREGLTAVISLKIPENKLEFEGQTKGKLGSPDAGPAVTSVLTKTLTYFLNEHSAFALDLIKKCSDARDVREAARKAKELARGTKKKTNTDFMISDKLASAQSKDYAENELFIVEGDSAGGSAKTGRDRLHQAILPLRGKPLNTEDVSIQKISENLEFSTLINTIGAGVGQDFKVEDSKYGKIIIMTDADDDGSHIQTLLLTFFYNFMKPLIDAGMVYIAQPPLYRVYKKSDPSKHIYCWNDDELGKARDKIGAGYGVNRYKGLGEMNADQLAETTMNKKTRQLLQVVINNPIIVEKKISTLMGSDSEPRWQWIQENVSFAVDEDDYTNEMRGKKNG